MEPIEVTTSFKWSAADIMAELTNEGGVTIWFQFNDIGQRRHDITCNPEEWDRLVAWVEWQRKEAVLKKAD
jgi:hypothetical protein